MDSGGNFQKGGLNHQLQHRMSLRACFNLIALCWPAQVQVDSKPITSRFLVPIGEDKSVLEQLGCVDTMKAAASGNPRAKLLSDLTCAQLEELAREATGLCTCDVTLLRTYIAQTFAGKDDTPLRVTHAVLDRQCKASQYMERHIHACVVLDDNGSVSERIVRLFSALECVCVVTGATHFGLLVQPLDAVDLEEDERPQFPFEKHAVSNLDVNGGFQVIRMDRISSLVELYASCDTDTSKAIWVLPTRFKNLHLRSASGE
jgi:hypothetical protein